MCSRLPIRENVILEGLYIGEDQSPIHKILESILQVGGERIPTKGIGWYKT